MRLLAAVPLLLLGGCHLLALPPVVIGAALGFGTRALQLDTAVIQALTPKPAAPLVCVPDPVGDALNGVSTTP